MRKIILEILRHGISHNQLLSRLTQYIAICGHHPTNMVTLPFDHYEFLQQHNELRYSEGLRPSRELQVRVTAERMKDILSSVKGLHADLNAIPSRTNQLTHLELVISAAELALLPFELADTPDGCPGAGQPLFLQTQLPLCITRRVRRHYDDDVVWPSKPRILFIAAAPEQSVPYEEHLKALQDAVDPWVSYSTPSARQKDRDVAKHLVCLKSASVADIKEAIDAAEQGDWSRGGPFTHIHILAHGTAIDDGMHRHYGLLLHDSNNPLRSDKVDGRRLATALRTQQKSGSSLSYPTVVTIASCDSGNVGTMIGPAASLAHMLHESGVPLVIASQFPLSVVGSNLMVEFLYENLLWGYDPRALLSNLRRRLASKFSDTHDWASLVAYATLPNNFEEQLSRVRVERTKASIDAALEIVDHYFQRVWWVPAGQEVQPEENLEKDGIERLQTAKGKLDRLATELEGRDDPVLSAEIAGLVASTLKREADLKAAREGEDLSYPLHYYEVSGDPVIMYLHEAVKPAELHGLLLESRQHYRKAFMRNKDNVWAVVQHLALSAALGDTEYFKPRAWHLAHTLSRWDLWSKNPAIRSQALANLVELYVLAELLKRWGALRAVCRVNENLARASREETFAAEDLVEGQKINEPESVSSLVGETPRFMSYTDAAIEHALQLVRCENDESFLVFSTRRQLSRYLFLFLFHNQPKSSKSLKQWQDTYGPVANIVIRLLDPNVLPLTKWELESKFAEGDVGGVGSKNHQEED